MSDYHIQRSTMHGADMSEFHLAYFLAITLAMLVAVGVGIIVYPIIDSLFRRIR